MKTKSDRQFGPIVVKASGALLGVALMLLAAPGESAGLTLIASNATWKYLDTGVDLGTAWIAPAFNDAAWASGRAQLGYGDGDEATVINGGPIQDKFITTYFRHRFNVPDVNTITALRAWLLFDDGAVVYVNGVEAFRANMLPGEPSYDSRADALLPDNSIQMATLSPSLLVNGTNVVAVEVHQASVESTDLSFALELLAERAPRLVGWPQVSVPPGLDDAIALSLGDWHALALRRDGTVVAWGSDLYGATNVPPGLSDVVAIAAGEGQSLAATADGTLVAWGNNVHGQASVPLGLRNVVGVAGGGRFSMALRADGTVVAWGSGGWGETNVPAGLNDVVAIAAGHEFALALRRDGTVAAWGSFEADDNEYPAYIPAGLTDVIAVSAGENHALALRADGTVVAWGDSYHGETNVPSGLRDVVAVSAGLTHSLALKSNGTVIGWGDDQFNPPAALSNVVVIEAGSGKSLALIGNGAPAVAVQPFSQSVPAGGVVRLHVRAVGQPPLRYQWQKDGVPLAGATNATLVLSDVHLSDAGVYAAMASNAAGSVISDTATVAVSASPDVLSARELQEHPAIASDGVNFLVVWMDRRHRVSSWTEYDIYGARVTPAGEVLDPNGIAICTNAAWQQSPAVAFDGTNFFVVWSDTLDSEWTIRGARVSRSGQVLDPDGITICDWPGLQSNPRVAFNNGIYLVTWNEWRNQSAEGPSAPAASDVYGARVSVTGTVLDPGGFPIVAAPHSQWDGQVTPLDAQFLSVWHDTSGLRGATISRDGVASVPFVVATSHTSGPSGHGLSSAGATGWLTWNEIRVQPDNSFFTDVYGARLNADGWPFFTRLLATNVGYPNYIASAVANFGFWAVYETSAGATNSDVRGLFVPAGSSSGTPWPVAISTYSGRQDQPAIACNGSGSLVVWRDGRRMRDRYADQDVDIHGTFITASGEVVHPNGFLISSQAKIEPILTWRSPAPITYGTPLSSVQLTAGSEVSGSFAYDPPAGTVLNAGVHTLRVTFTPTDAARYSTASAQVTLTVQKAPLTILADHKSKIAGQPNPPLTATYVGLVAGNTPANLDTPVILATTATIDSPPGTYPITATGASDANYTIVHQNGVLSVVSGTKQPGTVDLAFDARIAALPGSYYSALTAAALQPDGRILLGGNFTNVGSLRRDNLARVMPDGSGDATFLHQGGLVFPRALAIQPDGRILIGGTASGFGAVFPPIRRLHADGTLDSSFQFFWPPTNYARVDAMALQPDGRVVLNHLICCGPDGNGTNVILRVHADGSQDHSFQPLLIYQLDDDLVTSIVLQPDGRMLIAGYILAHGLPMPRHLARLNPNGTIDPSFQPAVDGGVHAVVVQPDGRVLIGGWFSHVDSEPRTGLARLNPDGSLDPTFQPLPWPGYDVDVTVLALQPDGRVLVGGYRHDEIHAPGEYEHFLVRLLPDGGIDSAFSPVEFRETELLGGEPELKFALLQPDGGLLVGGRFNRVNGVPRTHLVRLHTGSSTPPIAQTAILIPTNAVWRYNDSGADPGAAWRLPGYDDRTWKSGIGKFGFGEGDENTVLNIYPSGNPGTGSQITTYYFRTHFGMPPPTLFTNLTLRILRDDGIVVYVNGFEVRRDNMPPGPIGFTNYASDVVGGDDEDRFFESTLPAPSLVPGTNVLAVELHQANAFSGDVAFALELRGEVRTNPEPPLVFGYLRREVYTDIPGLQVADLTNDAKFPDHPDLVHLVDTFEAPSQFGDNYGQRLSGFVLPPVSGEYVFYLSSDDQSLLFLSTTESPAHKMLIAREPQFSPPRQWVGGGFGRTNNENISPPIRLEAGRRYYVEALHKEAGGGDSLGVAWRKPGDPAPVPGAPPISGQYLAVVDDGAGTNVPPTVTIVATDPDAAEGSIAPGVPDTATFEIRRTGSTDQPLGVLLSITGTAIQGVDYAALSPYPGSHWVTIPVAAASADVVITPIDDAIPEDIETVVVQILPSPITTGIPPLPTDYWPGVPSQAMALIHDNDPATNAPPVITRGPVSLSRFAGQTAVFAVEAQGAAPLAYQWLFNGTAIAGANTATLTLADLQPGQEGDYRVRISGSGGAAVSPAARLTVLGPFTGSGSLDITFDPTAGGQWVGPASGTASVACVRRQWDGKWLIGGTFVGVDGKPRNRIARLNGDGTLDSGFNPGFGADGPVLGIEVQADGKVVIIGGFSLFNGQPRDGIARLHPDGALDETFHPIVRARNLNAPTQLALQPDGRILIGGSITNVNGVARLALARLHPDGSLDPSFNAAAVMTNQQSAVGAITLQSDGRILVAGTLGQPTRPVARLHPDGSPDVAFVAPEIRRGSGQGSIRSMALAGDGRIVIGGTFSSINGVERFGVARLLANGSLDAAFNAGRMQPQEPVVTRVLVQPNGQVVLGGKFTSINGWTRKGMARLNANGTVDSSFDPGLVFPAEQFPWVNDLALLPDGRFFVAPGSASWTALEPILQLRADGSRDADFHRPLLSLPAQLWKADLQPDGKVVIPGDRWFSYHGQARAVVARLNPDGTLDAAFNPQLGGQGAYVVAAQNDGKILLGGEDFILPDGTRLLHVIRLNPNGSLDSSFATAEGDESPSGWVSTLLIQPDGRILVAGDFHSIRGADRSSLARLHADGTVDESFRLDPNIVLDYDDAAPIHPLALQPDGKIIVAGLFERLDGGLDNVARLHSNGNLDATFHPPVDGVGRIDAAAVLADGRILLAGTFRMEGDSEWRAALLRLHPEGSLDMDFPTSDMNQVNALRVQPDGKLLVAGNRLGEGLVRFNADGTLDATFTSGVKSGLSGAYLPILLLQPDGQVLVGGTFSSVNGVPMHGMARLNNDVAGTFVTRAISTPQVRLIAAPAAGTSVYAVEDQVSPAAVIAQISHGGVFDEITGKVKFGPFYDGEPRALSYSVLIPPGCIHDLCGRFTFTGTASADGVNVPIAGDQMMLVVGLHPADVSSPDGQLAIAEVTAYGAAWRRGEPWPVPPIPIPIAYATRAAALWRGGECYEFDPTIASAPLWWVNCVAQASSSVVDGDPLPRAHSANTPGGSLTPEPSASEACAARIAPSAFVAGETIPVTIRVQPPPQGRAYAVEDNVPAGWAVTEISHNGEFDALQGAVRWGPFADAAPRVLSYRGTPPRTARGAAAFGGTFSCDGSNAAIGGVHETRSTCRLIAQRATAPGRFRLQLAGELGTRWRIESSVDLENWTGVATVTNEGSAWEFSDAEGAPVPQRFYRAVPAE